MLKCWLLTFLFCFGNNLKRLLIIPHRQMIKRRENFFLFIINAAFPPPTSPSTPQIVSKGFREVPYNYFHQKDFVLKWKLEIIFPMKKFFKWRHHTTRNIFVVVFVTWLKLRGRDRVHVFYNEQILSLSIIIFSSFDLAKFI